MKNLIVIAVILMSAVAFAEMGVTCTRLTILKEQTLCRATADGQTTIYTLHINTESSASVQTITESEYLAFLKADTDATAKYTKELQDYNARAAAIEKYGKRYYEKGLACEQSGGKWSFMKHSCKAAR